MKVPKESASGRAVVRIDASNGKVLKRYSQLDELAKILDVSAPTAYYKIKSMKPYNGEMYMFEDEWEKRFPMLSGKDEEMKEETIDNELELVTKPAKTSRQADKQTSEPDKQTSGQADNVNHPSHYCTGGIECFDAMLSTFGKDWMIVYCNINAFKYAWRAKHKNNFVEDMRKSAWYSTKAAELAEMTEGRA